MTHQRQRALVGPTSSGKVYNNSEDADDESSLNLEIREKVTEVRNGYQNFSIFLLILFFILFLFLQINAHIAMRAMNLGAPKDYMQLLKEHADIVNLPRVGVDQNVAFPAMQANVAPAVALDDSLGIQHYNQQHIPYIHLCTL